MRRLLVTALVAVLTVTPALADPAATELPRAESGSAQCGPDVVTWNNVRSFNRDVAGTATLDASGPDERPLLHVEKSVGPGEVLMPRWCADLLGDGSQVLGYEMYSGGAHCCFTATVVPLAPGASDLLDVKLGNAGLGLPQQLSEAGPLQIVAGSDVFAYFGNLSFAASPFMPLVFAYDGQQYVEATRQFADPLRAEIARLEADLPGAVAQPVPTQVPPQFRFQEQESIALHLYGLHVLLGDADAALPSLEARLSPPVAEWLATNAPAAADAMAGVYDLSSPTSASPSE